MPINQSSRFLGIRVTKGEPFTILDLEYFLNDRIHVALATEGPNLVQLEGEKWEYSDLPTSLPDVLESQKGWTKVGRLRNLHILPGSRRLVFARRRQVLLKRTRTWEVELIASYLCENYNNHDDGHRLSEQELMIGGELAPLLQIRDWRIVDFDCDAEQMSEIVDFVLQKIESSE